MFQVTQGEKTVTKSEEVKKKSGKKSEKKGEGALLRERALIRWNMVEHSTKMAIFRSQVWVMGLSNKRVQVTREVQAIHADTIGLPLPKGQHDAPLLCRRVKVRFRFYGLKVTYSRHCVTTSVCVLVTVYHTTLLRTDTVISPVLYLTCSISHLFY